MALSDSRWHASSQSPCPWEQDALDYLREHLPNEDPWHVWPLFEFVADSGAPYEVDALVLSPKGLWLVEIKSNPGTVSGDHQTWAFKHEGRFRTIDNPVLLANRKAKALKGILSGSRKQRGLRIPWIDPLIFLSANELSCDLDTAARPWVCVRENRKDVGKGQISGILSAMTTGDVVGTTRDRTSDVRRRDVPGIVRTIQAVVQPGSRRERVGDYRLEDLIEEGSGYQDRVAQHQTQKKIRRRARCYLVAQGASKEERARIQNAATREAGILEMLRHEGVLQFRDLVTAESGPILLFDYDAEAERLDHWLSARPAIEPDAALDVLQQLAEALRAAHAHGLVHRALSPRSVLVTCVDGSPKVRLYNWQTALRLSGSSSSGVSGTVHVDSLVDDNSGAYIAPEAISDPEIANEAADVFSLGAIAFRLFSGQPPAANQLELTQALSEHDGLRLSASCDGVAESLDTLIAFATQANPMCRLTLDEFRDQLAEVWNELTQPDADVVADPLNAEKGDKLRDDETRDVYEVVERLGLGASALALRVKKVNDEARPVVLKIARGSDHYATLEKEFAILSRLHDSTVVPVEKLTTFGGHTTIVMHDAGENLASRLRDEGRLSLDLLQPLGEDLLSGVDYLEIQSVFHRDLKPENMGIRDSKIGSKKRLSLVVFDFSLASASAKNILVGTRQYLDPFLKLRRPAVYDAQAERYAAAVSLYEMATGTHPEWGDGAADPAADSSCELDLKSALFPASCRDDMVEFFEKALHRDPSERFDNAREMLRAWSQIFVNAEETIPSGPKDVDREQALAEATLETPLASLGLSTRAFNGLDRLNVLSVRVLLRLSGGDLVRVRGIGHKTKREISEVQQRLRERFPDEKEQPLELHADIQATTLSQAKEASVDHLYHRVTEQIGRDKQGHKYRLAMMGVGEVQPRAKHPWPTQGEVGDHFGITRAAVSINWTRAINSRSTKAWGRSFSLSDLRDTVAEMITRHGGVMAAEELGLAVLAQRGSALADKRERLRHSLAVLRVVLALEEKATTPRFTLYRRAASFVANSSELADYADRLGKEADCLAAQWPPASPGRALERLRAVTAPGNLETEGFLADRRLFALAAAAAGEHTHLATSGQEFYPQGMPSDRALELASGSLAGLPKVTIQEIQNRVYGRYPEAELLPGPPKLHDLIKRCELGLKWDASQTAYVREMMSATSMSRMSMLRSSTGGTPPREPSDPERQEAERQQKALADAIAEKRFLAIQVRPQHAPRALQAFEVRFPALSVMNLEGMLLDAMKAKAQGIGAEWDVVTAADSASRGSSHWQNLCRLVREAVPSVRDRLMASREPLLVLNPGMIARYGQIDLIEALRDRSGTPDGPPGCFVLIPTQIMRALPVIDGVALPVLGSMHKMALSETWIAEVVNGD